ncbi:MAG: 2-oxo acid dehydrogenase subunit E2 [Candidatus Aenigmarchaeota archaeon]|nr:2-oxo acid dehydrogenase subunit E2 [Candidatus Aenigmarchaeota archaeon]
MPVDFKFPDVGEGITEGELVELKVKEGQMVKEHDVLLKIETDKAVVDMPSPASGTILKIYHKVGDTVKVGESLVTIGKPGEVSQQSAKEQPVTQISERTSTSVMGELEDADAPERKSTQADKPIIATELSGPAKHAAAKMQENKEIYPQHALATPSVRRLAKEININLENIHGTGLNGRITEEDVRKYGSTEYSAHHLEGEGEIKIVKKYDMWGYIEHSPLKGVRKAIAKHMVQSAYTAPHVTHMDECDVTVLWNHREQEKAKAEKKGVHLTFMPFVIKACIAALKEYPHANSSLDDEHEEIILKKYYNIGAAVDTEDGLMVPVIKGADQKSILDISKELEDLAKKARERSLDLMDMKGGTFTITNIGSIGGLHATPIINYPEAAILALGRIYDKVTVNQQEKIVVRKYLPFSLAFDHRIFDGAYAARFANKLKQYLEDPDELLIEGK